MDKAKIIDYGTTLLFFGVAAAVTYQAQIMAHIPQEYSVLALIGFGILSQVAADARVKAKVGEAQEEIDATQAALEEQKAKAEAAYAQANAKVDEVQAAIEEAVPVDEGGMA